MNYTDRRAQTPWLCTFYNADFLIYSSMASFYIPCVLMILLYWRIFRAIHHRADRKSAQRTTGVASPVPTGLPVSEATHCFRAELDSDRQVRSRICPVQSSISSEFLPVARVAPRRVEVRMNKMAGSRLTVYNTIRLTSDPEVMTTTTGRAVSCPDCSTSSEDLLEVQSENFTATTTAPRVYAGQNLLSVCESSIVGGGDGAPLPVTEMRRKSDAIRRKLRMRMRRAPVFHFTAKPTPKVEKASTKREKKATKTLAIVLGKTLAWLLCYIRVWLLC